MSGSCHEATHTEASWVTRHSGLPTGDDGKSHYNLLLYQARERGVCGGEGAL